MTSAQKRDALDTAYDSWHEDQLEDETPEKYCDRCHKLTDAYREQSGEVLCEKCIRELERNAQPTPMAQRTSFERETMIIHDEPILASPEQLKQAWDKLLQTPSYVERDLRDVPMFFEATDAYIEIENAIREGDFVYLVPMEDEPIHTDSRPFCSDPECPCHYDDSLFEEYIYEPMMAGLLTSYEANAIRWNEQI